MAESVVLATQKRDGRGSHAAAKLRKQGMIPAVLYGHKEATDSVALSGEELGNAIRHGVRVVDLQSDAGVQKALIREIQWDHLGKDILHVDFARVSKDERIKVTVPIEVKGIAPGVTAGGLLGQPMHLLHVECLAVSIPDHIRVNVNELQLGNAIHVSELHLPEGVNALDDPNAIVVQVTAPQAEAEAGAEPAAEQAEPELIGRKAGDEEGEEEK